MNKLQGDEAFRRASYLNRTVLLLNLAVLVVNFIVALGATDSQVELAQVTLRSAGAGPVRRPAMADPSPAYLRVVQSLEGAAPPGTVGADQLRCLYAAVVRYYEVVSRGVSSALWASGDGEAARKAFADLSRDARGEVERELGSSFRDAALATRLTTDILRECR
jgi:hypothetical protein